MNSLTFFVISNPAPNSFVKLDFSLVSLSRTDWRSLFRFSAAEIWMVHRFQDFCSRNIRDIISLYMQDKSGYNINVMWSRDVIFLIEPGRKILSRNLGEICIEPPYLRVTILVDLLFLVVASASFAIQPAAFA